MTRDEVKDRLKKALEQHFGDDGETWGIAVGAPPDGFGLSDHPSAHNFMVTISVPLKE